MEHNLKNSLNKWNIPGAESNGFVPTLNDMGYMTSTIDVVSKHFIDKSLNLSNPALEIGCAYGNAVKRFLEEGTGTIYANDLDNRHLEILSDSLEEEEKRRVSFFRSTEI